LLEIRNLSVQFPTPLGQVQAVRGVSLKMKAGQTLAIVGESGSGKSVTVQSVMRLLPRSSQLQGEILWNGRNLLECTEKQMESIRGKEIGMVFQDPMTALNPTMKVGRQIAEGILRHQRVSPKQALQRAVELLKMVGIPDAQHRANNFPHEYSGGMRQRVVTAIAIASSPQLLIADEPTTALDVTVQAQILDLLKALQKQFQMGLLLITHDLAVVSEVADEVAVMYAGKVIEFGTVDEVLQRPRHPYTRGLLSSRPRAGDRSPLNPVPGSPPDLLMPPSGCSFTARCPYAMRICKEQDPPQFSQHQHNMACWLFHPQAEGREG